MFLHVFILYVYIYIYIHIPRESKDQTLPLGSRESFTWITLKTILCLVLDFHGIYIYTIINLLIHDLFRSQKKNNISFSSKKKRFKTVDRGPSALVSTCFLRLQRSSACSLMAALSRSCGKILTYTPQKSNIDTKNCHF